MEGDVQPSMVDLDVTPDQQAHRDRLTLLSEEVYWRDHYTWLVEQGYMLRPRYKPGWIPSWKDTGRRWTRFEDGIILRHPAVVDATRLSNKETVILKRFSRAKNVLEKELTIFLASEPMKSHPRNHSTPVYEVLDLPGEDISIFVMPVLDDFNRPHFETVGEVLECFRQVFEGLQFLHECHIAHRDLMYLNIMMDSRKMWPEPYHIMVPSMNRGYTSEVKKPFTRTAKTPRYYIIDYGLSRRYSPDDPYPMERLPEGGDRTVPEFGNSLNPTAHDPFAVDIYCLGNVIQKYILDAYTGCEFLKPLVDAMREPVPNKRLTIWQVNERYNEILKLRWWWQLRARVAFKMDERQPEDRIINRSQWLFNTIGHIVTFKNALPKPKN